MTIDFDRSQLEIKQRQSKLLEVYEGKIQSLLQESIDHIIDEDVYTERQEDLRRAFLSDMNNTLKEVDITTPEIHFKNLMSKALLNQIKRAFGYYEAIQELKPKINQYNMQLGEQVLETSTRESFKLIEKIEKVLLITEIVEAMNMAPKYSEKLVNLVIEREFGVHKS
jgi:hypothetical protein